MTTIGDWLNQAKARLASSTVFEDDVNLTLKFLLEARLDIKFPFSSATALSSQEETQLNKDLDELYSGRPLPYTIGEWSFYGLDFIVSSDVLIPRPETELLVEKALGWLEKCHEGHRPLVYDVGTGSGIIAITISKFHPSCFMLASDISAGALSICEQNMIFHGLQDRINLTLADGIPNREEKIDLLCANLPYIPENIVDGLQVNTFEPRLALDGGVDGLRIIEKVLAQSVSRMKQHSLLLFEIESSQGLLAQSVAAVYYPHSTISILTDLAGKNRLLSIENK